MSPPPVTLFSLLLLLTVSTSASAQRIPSYRATPSASSPELEQSIYKGLVGNVLDAIPMDPSNRVDLQRANAVISNTVSGRSLAVLVGLSNPVLLIGGLIWGVWAASNIKPADLGVKLTTDSGQSVSVGNTPARIAALVAPAAAVDDTPAKISFEPVLVSLNSAGNSGEAAHSRPPVIKIWLPQRSSTLVQ